MLQIKVGPPNAPLFTLDLIQGDSMKNGPDELDVSFRATLLRHSRAAQESCH